MLKASIHILTGIGKRQDADWEVRILFFADDWYIIGHALLIIRIRQNVNIFIQEGEPLRNVVELPSGGDKLPGLLVEDKELWFHIFNSRRKNIHLYGENPITVC